MTGAATPCGACGRTGCDCVSSAFWSVPDVVEALTDGDAAAVIRLARRHIDITQRDLAAITGLSQPMISHIERGGALRNPDKQAQALRGLGAPAPQGRSVGPSQIHAAAGIGEEGRQRMRRASAAPSRIDAPAVRAFADLLAAQRRLDDSLGPAALLPVALARMEPLRALARDARGAHQADLRAVAAEHVQFTGWLYASSGHLDQALPLLVEAEELAEELENGPLLAQALNFRGYVARQKNNPRGQIRHFQAAYDTSGAHPAQRMGDAAQAAHGHALIGQREEAQRLLGRALELRDEAAVPPPDTAYWLTPDYQLLNLGLAHLGLGDSRQACELLKTGLETLPADQQNAQWTREYRQAFRDASEAT